ncbi:MAG TPA: peptidase T [Firmicutes bacterium]|nr:peptidase T [Bacillota bacterium]
MKRAYERLLEYVKFDTASDANSPTVPSTMKQKDLGEYLVKEMKAMGIQDAEMDDKGYVYASIPATPGCENVPKIGFLAHLDTVDDVPACQDPRIVEKYDGSDVVLNQEHNVLMRLADFPSLQHMVGDDIIVTNGLTLLGADDKAGIAEILTAVERLLEDPSIPHGAIKMAFTPDEEIGRGPAHFDVKRFDADFGYTVDGGVLGGVEYENFNAASTEVTVNGLSVHPGSAKNQMKNANYIAMEYNAMLPQEQKPEYTEGYEGFYFLRGMEGSVEKVSLHYMLRDHDAKKFAEKKAMMDKVAAFLNEKYGEGTVEVATRDMYYNMREKIEPQFHLVQAVLDAMNELGVEPVISPIRGGTDGSQLTYMGLPCPNFCTGGANAHGRFETVSIQAMDKITDIIEKIIVNYAKKA